jgi:hypothetical protein
MSADAGQPVDGSRLLLFFGVRLGCFASVVRRMLMVAVGHVRVVCGLMDLTRFVVLGGLAVVVGGALVVFRGLLMVLDGVLHDDLRPKI